jgi:geranylgeranyl diphosphate synthase type I
VDREALRQRVTEALAAFLHRQRPRLEAISPDLDQVTDVLEAFLLDGGKRLRPAFAYWGWRGAAPEVLAGPATAEATGDTATDTGADTATGQVSDPVITAVASLEWLQACALIHDDVMDGSDTRRGKPSVHRRFGNLHRQRGWQGEPESFGASAAILLGDLALVWADEMLDDSGLPAEALVRAQPVYNRMRTELMAGQYLDLLEQAVGGRSVEHAMTVARYKTAKYTIERPLHFGAALAGGGPELSRLYSAYGLPLGEAFQLRDDILGVFGDPSTTGKPAGDDLREGKRTVLVAQTLERATPAQAELISQHLGDPGLSEEGVYALREVISDTGALAESERLIEQLTEQALSALDDPLVEPTAAEVLRELAGAATARKV